MGFSWKAQANCHRGKPSLRTIGKLRREQSREYPLREEGGGVGRSFERMFFGGKMSRRWSLIGRR